jgi:uncharacterized protein YjbI with pentapeptide repeats
VSSGGITGTPASLPDPGYNQASLVDGYLLGPDVDLDNADLAGADLAEISFQAATFVDADLAGANLSDTAIDGNLAGANIAGATLKGASLGGVSSGGLTGTPAALPADWLLKDGYLIGPNAQLVGADLTGVDLAHADLQWTNLDEANLTDASLASADLAYAGVASATLSGTNLAGASLAQITSGSITGTPEALPLDWTLRDGYLFGPKAWLFYTDLSGMDLSGLDLADADLEGAILTGTNLSRTNAAGADLDGAQIADVDVTGTVLGSASLYTIRSGGGVTGSPASLPRDWVLRSGWLIGPSVFLDNDNLNGVNLSETDMAAAEFSSSTFHGANLTGANLSGAFFFGADFTSADLVGADLYSADFDAVTWTNAICPDGTRAASHDQSCANATTLAFRITGFITPRPGSTVRVSAKRIIVRVRLATASGGAIPASIAAVIAAAKELRATLAGPGIRAATVYCSWYARGKDFVCAITDPRGIRKGKKHSYSITIAEGPANDFYTAPHLGKAVNPETIHFE